MQGKDVTRRLAQLDMLETIVEKDMPEMLGNWQANRAKKTKVLKRFTMDGMVTTSPTLTPLTLLAVPWVGVSIETLTVILPLLEVTLQRLCGHLLSKMAN